ncbi:MAG: hypothetical protein ACO4BJ_10000 [Planctomycetota bacterium]
MIPALPTLPLRSDLPLRAPSRGSAATEVPADIRRAADGFEALFVMQLLEPLEKSGQALFGEGPQGRTVGGLFREQLASRIAEVRPIGVAGLIEQELLARRIAGIESPAPQPTVTNPVAVSRAAETYRKAMS